ncbi:PrsW family intramembrane metalloprotease [Nakamurella endophytica]|uniref:Protease PrsW n=1 Tax=Nakamurella endophytica TaxID=1748367 RepID=A0A917WFS5_9ACTN|nr:PrsW family intramembrane metalloprotease [Nakamurella endophytica]GGL99000.1 protease PrsW [Nakamurella endophytica]
MSLYHHPAAGERTAVIPGTRPGSLPRGTWLAVLLVGAAIFEALRHTLLSTQNPNLLPALILVGALVVPAAFLAFIYSRRLAFDVPGGVLAVAALVGGLIGVIVAGTVEYDTVRRLGTLPMVGVALIEETAKLVLPALLLLWGRYRTPADGLLVGVASGASFAVLETMGYAFVTLIVTRGNVTAVGGVLMERGVLSPAGHMAWTGLTAAALWMAAVERWSARAVLRFVLVFAVAVGLHTAWDSIGTLTGYIVLAVLGLGALAHVTHQLHVRRPASPNEPAVR